MAVKLSPEAWAASADREALRRSKLMEPVMDAIAGEFVCYQYDHEKQLAFRSAEWDLYFHCNMLNVSNASAAGRDYSYFTLTFNREHTEEKRLEIYSRIMRLLQERFADQPNLHISVQYRGSLDAEKSPPLRSAIASVHGRKAVLLSWLGRPACTGRGQHLLYEETRQNPRVSADAS